MPRAMVDAAKLRQEILYEIRPFARSHADSLVIERQLGPFRDELLSLELQASQFLPTNSCDRFSFML